jgi:phage shock protein PspC (stress-responsive transcriptional regulator)
MRQVITVSLNGRAYQLEDDAYAVLGSYLGAAAVALAGNPDKDEIVADLEQAIADKCDRYLSPHKTVVGRAELARVIDEMGPVDGAAPEVGPAPAAGSAAGVGAGAAPASPAGAAAPAGDGAAPKRLYQISEGALISGVCNGIAAYLAVDVTLVRLGFVAAAFLTGGGAVLVYLVLMFVVPYASTSEEHAAARGLPFNARALVERAKQKAAEFANSADWQGSKEHWKNEWRSEWRRARAEWRTEWRRTRAEWRARRWSRPPPPPPPPPASARPVPYAAHVVTGVILAALGVVLALWTIGWIIALASLVMTGAIFGWGLPHDVPFWLGILVLIILYQAVAWPLKAVRRAAYYPGGGYHVPWVAAWDGVVGFAILFALAWYGYHHVPEVRDLFDHLGRALDRTGLTV